MAAMSASYVLIVSGCVSTTLPPRVTTAQRAGITAADCHGVSIGVERYSWPVYSERLIVALRATDLFGRVDALDAFGNAPTWVARVDRPIYGTAVVPWLTGFSLGLIPTTVDEEHGYSFSLAPSAAPMQSMPVEFSYHGPSTLGWQALFVNLFRDGTATNVYHHPRMVENLAWTIVESEKQICRDGLLRASISLKHGLRRMATVRTDLGRRSIDRDRP